MNLPRSFRFCRNQAFPAITDNDIKMAHLSKDCYLQSFRHRSSDQARGKQ